MASDSEWSDSYLHLGEAVDNLRVTTSKARPSCLCGHTFRKVEDMYEHAEEANHLVKCGCGELYGTQKALLMHQREVQHDHVLSHTKLEASYDQLGEELTVATVSDLSPRRPADTPAFVCFCGDEFDFVQELYEHATEEGHRLKCGCGHLCGSRRLIIQHQDGTVHEEKKSVTTLEAVKGLPGGNLALPAITHVSGEYLKPSNCNRCPGRKFRNAAALEQHNKDMHPSTPAPAPAVFSCRHCRPKKFATARQLREHEIEKHPSCPVCYMEFHDIFKKEYQLRTAADVAIPFSSAQTQVFQNQRATMHCHCEEHNMAFCSTELYSKHCIQHNEKMHKNTQDCLREGGYISRRRSYGYECKVCQELQ
ncbi:Myeloid differentiation primary response protein MyD88 [Extremus antarcticus]|uniref:Myeloid differentiation primary response protein MyD88 n=1 Tax=Extremus antarcticus TaxID=702011 RepID=A0AAJ0G6M8_9PEZI|nr:Myeloid differentiation primary response protein MyD88 [Extremus antarcticus]